VFASLALCYGVAGYFKCDELLACVVVGGIVANFNVLHDKIFSMLERYTEERIFVLFFTISGLHLNFVVLLHNVLPVFVFIILRALGKFWGVRIGSFLTKAPPKVQKYTIGGLIPQGGIVIGLALVAQQNPAFASFSNVLINVILGSTVLHELFGPVISKWSLTKAGEISEGYL
ncbi:MAG: cation:proton antiporter, partial [Candidatus Omnitrophica bacterium]|nr:cation:proton antiporter [Candidatus Omnitrophota bacterium]